MRDLLMYVWQALEDLGRRFPALWPSGAEFVTAVSADDVSLRALLRVPTASCTGPRYAELVASVRQVLAAVPCLHDVAVRAVPHVPARPAEQAESLPGGAGEHGCGGKTLPELVQAGWRLDGVVGQAARKSLPAEDGRPTVRLTVRALIDQAAATHDRQPDPGRGAADHTEHIFS